MVETLPEGFTYMSPSLNQQAVAACGPNTLKFKLCDWRGYRDSSKTSTGQFDTVSPANPYPSIFGTHTGTVTPSQTITVQKLYTYPCPGTGSHSESIELYENGTLIAHGTWNSYKGDWHKITLNSVAGTPYLTLLKDHVYGYTIRTGSYPAIIQETTYNATGGTITCTDFTGANGKSYFIGWIRQYYLSKMNKQIRLFYEKRN